jgi:hypothetical protein
MFRSGMTGLLIDIKSWLRGNVTGLFGVLSVFGHRIKGMIWLQLEQMWMCNVTLDVHTCCLFPVTLPCDTV